MQETTTSPIKFENGCLYVALLACVLLYVHNTFIEPEFHSHLAFGLNTLAALQPPRVDHYSYLTEGGGWVDPYWLSELLLGAVFSAGKYAALVALHFVLLAAIFSIVLLRLFFTRIPAGIAAILTVFMVVLVGKQDWNLLNVNLINISLFLTMLLILQLACSKKSKTLLLLTPYLLMLWFNCAPQAVLGAAAAAVWAIAYLVDSTLKKENLSWSWYLLGTAGLCILCCLVNPYGFGLIQCYWATATAPKFLPPQCPLHAGSALGAVYLLFCGICYWVLRKRMFVKEPATSVVVIGCLLLPFAWLPLLPAAPAAALVLMAPHLAALLSQQSLLNRLPALPSIRGLWSRAGAVLVVGALLTYSIVSSLRGAIFSSVFLPEAAISILRDSHVEANLACSPVWADYAIFHVGPRIKVAADTRFFEAYDANAIGLVQGLINVQPGGYRLITLYPTDLVLVDKTESASLYAVMKLQPNWRLVYEDIHSALFVRKDFKAAQQVLSVIAKPPAASAH